ncbi:alpha/beta fold hydrolase [Nocardiopsis tropica]
MWDGVVAALPRGFEAVRYDQRDRGGANGRRPFGLDDLVDDLFEAMDAVGADAAHVVGVSLGGLVGLRAASREPRRVTSLTAMCCAARFPRDVWTARARTVRTEGLDGIVTGVIERWFTPAFREHSPEVVAGYRAMLAATDPRGYALACDVLAEADVRTDLPSISAPTLVVSAEADVANPVRDQRLIAAAVPGARHAILPGTAHLAPAARPAEVASLVCGHIASVPAR